MFARLTSAAAAARGAGSRRSFGTGATGIWEFIEGFCCAFWGRNHAGEKWGELLTFRKKKGSGDEKKATNQTLCSVLKRRRVSWDSCETRTSNQVHFKSLESNWAWP